MLPLQGEPVNFLEFSSPGKNPAILILISKRKATPLKCPQRSIPGKGNSIRDNEFLVKYHFKNPTRGRLNHACVRPSIGGELKMQCFARGLPERLAAMKDLFLAILSYEIRSR